MILLRILYRPATDLCPCPTHHSTYIQQQYNIIYNMVRLRNPNVLSTNTYDSDLFLLTVINQF